MTDEPAPRRSTATWWLPERRRVSLSMAAAVVVAVSTGLLARTVHPMTSWDAGVIVLFGYLLPYFAVTVVAFTRAHNDEIRNWAKREDRGTVLQRYVFGTAPGPGVSLTIAAAALVVAVVWLPGYGGTALPSWLRITLAITLVALSWISVVVSFAVAFHADNLVEDEKALDFPGDREPYWSDYFYFAVAVMTTFGTTDVTVLSSRFRRTVTANVLIAYVFNTVVVASLVSALVGS